MQSNDNSHCKNCGASDFIVSPNVKTCKYCGSKVIVQTRTKQNVLITHIGGNTSNFAVGENINQNIMIIKK